MTDLTATLTAFFAEADAKVLADSIVRIEANFQRAVAFQNSDEAKVLDTWTRYSRIFNLAGGKTWWQALSGRNQAGRAELITKNCAAVAAKRNQTIINKLAKNGITEIGSAEVVRTSDGFNGIFKVAGKRVEIRTIYAGGYNIQCLHLRVLTYVN